MPVSSGTANSSDDPEVMGKGSATQQTDYVDEEVAIREVLDTLDAMPPSQPFKDLFELDRRQKPGSEAIVVVPAASTTARRDKRTVRCNSDIRQAEARGLVNGTRLPTSAMRGMGRKDTPEDDEDSSSPFKSSDSVMPQSAQVRPLQPVDRYDDNEPISDLRSYNYDSDEGRTRDLADLSPTERNSSAVTEPVARAKTRRSNDRARVYSLEPSQLRRATLPTNTVEDATQIAVLMTPPPALSFAVSESGPPTQDPLRYPSAPLGQVQSVKTYAKNDPTRSIRQVYRNPAERLEFRKQFSPEPEFERQILINDVLRTKRAGSTSLWPAYGGSTQGDERDDASDSTAYGSEEGEARLILGELQINERGQRVTRGRGRNGEWPDERQKGLFHPDTQEEHRPIELFRPVSERFHLAQQQLCGNATDMRYTPSPEEEMKPDIKRHNDRANYDHPLVHPAPRLNMSRSSSTADRLDV